jgi:signal transduction histidine kinase
LRGLLRGAGWEPIRQVFAGTWNQEISLLLVAILGGLLMESVKREPPLNADEVQAREREISYWRAAGDRARAIYEMAGTLSATLNPGRILDAVLEISAAAFEELAKGRDQGADRLVSAVFMCGEGGLYVASSRGLSYYEVDLVVPGVQGVLSEALGSGEPISRGGLGDDPELSTLPSFGRCQSAVGAPLCATQEIYGVVLFASSRPDAFSEEHAEMLKAVSSQAAMALTNAHLYQDLQREKENLLTVEEEARAKLARDLHDGPTQSISAIAMRLNFVRLLLDRDPERVREDLFKLENIARHTARDIRTLLFTMRPLVLETQGVQAAVEQLVERLFPQESEPHQVAGPHVELDIQDVDGVLDPSARAVVWFVTEESLNNVRKHANARNVSVKMGVQEGYVTVDITDDGDGFDVEAIMASYDQRTSYGLLGLQERAALVNGRTTIESTPGKGTQVNLVIPLSREAH